MEYKECHACMNYVKPIKIKEKVMSHQDNRYAGGFILYQWITKCPKCGEKRI